MQSRASQFDRWVDLDAHQCLLAAGGSILHHCQDHTGRYGVLHRDHGDPVLSVQFLDTAGCEEEASERVGA